LITLIPDADARPRPQRSSGCGATRRVFSSFAKIGSRSLRDPRLIPRNHTDEFPKSRISSAGRRSGLIARDSRRSARRERPSESSLSRSEPIGRSHARSRELKRRVERHYDGIPRCAVSPPHRVSAEPSSGACAPRADVAVTHARRAFIMLLRVNKIDALFSAR